jgi:hypothetical protein
MPGLGPAGFFNSLNTIQSKYYVSNIVREPVQIFILIIYHERIYYTSEKLQKIWQEHDISATWTPLQQALYSK